VFAQQIASDADQPGADQVGRIEAGPGGVGAQKHFLRQVFGVGRLQEPGAQIPVNGALIALDKRRKGGAVALLPAMPGWAFAAMVVGGLWLCLWTGRVRTFGVIPIIAGAAGAALSPSPDLLVTGDGMHLALVDRRTPLILRDRTGDYVRSLFAEASGFDGDPGLLGSRPYSACSRDACLAVLRKGTAEWRLLATRSATQIDWATITRACADADIVVSDRRLPRGCVPRWLKLDRTALAASGGLAIYLGDRPRIDTVADRVGAHPWAETAP